ncbi:MAG: hypothetical protein SV775_08660 [Thermodesulfobacteriota bacterium]|nr:hypothetical protein [Thermodesulfobacteriota bacterium]
MKEYEVLVGKIEAGKGYGQVKPGVDAQSPHILIEIPEEGKEVTVELRDPGTMGSFVARVAFFSDPARLPDGDRAIFIDQATRKALTESPWAVKIIEEIEEADDEVEVLPTRKLSLGERKGTLLKDMLESREKKRRQRES